MIENFANYLDQYSNGFKLAKQYCNGDNTTYYIIINRDIFSACKNLSCLKAFKYYYNGTNPYHTTFEPISVPEVVPKEQIVKNIVIITREDLLPVVCMCQEIDEVIVLSKSQLDDLEEYAKIPYRKYENLYPDERIDNDQYEEEYKLSTFSMQLKLPKSILDIHMGKLKISKERYDIAEDFINEFNLDVNQMVIINPTGYNKTLALEPSSWDPFIKYCVSKEFNVFTYINDTTTLSNTQMLDIPIGILMVLIEKGCKYVSVQNETLDLMHHLAYKNLEAIVIFKVWTETDFKRATELNYSNIADVSDNITSICSSGNALADAAIINLLIEKFEYKFVDYFYSELKIYATGYKLANIICKFDKNVIYLTMTQHIGDVARSLKIIKAIKKCLNIDNVIIITDKVLSGVTRLCEDVDEIITISKEQLDVLSRYARLPNRTHKNLFTEIPNDILYVSELFNFTNLQYELKLPINILKKYKSNFIIPLDTIDKAKNYMVENNLIPQETVVIIPYANSSSNFSLEDIQPLINYCIDKQYRVLTNCSPKENALPNTEKLMVDVDIFAGLLALGCKAIGVQSGLMDLLTWIENYTIRAIICCKSISLLDKYFAENKREKFLPEYKKLNPNLIYIKETKLSGMELNFGLNENINSFSDTILQTFIETYEHEE
ncbi:hypothetical protein AN396_00980 [Candidatus Epulonipiscium fishelsonii]|uniref:Uncharacterized protein n=1 Tax=Candidatus Epulonipiscium fishelsonii TaxID=77094 RepID=A0ACC8XDK1_9FIRM|nr:hypothetical protein AN396_00980 [Epulopiscium sp. SCG-B11WGA-EpuloA1]